MQLFCSTAIARRFVKSGSVVAIGNFDGVHNGHRQILKRVIQMACRHGLKSVLLTFEPHPVKVLSPQVAPKLINTPEQKTELVKEMGLDAVVMQKFDSRLAKKKPEDFFRGYLKRDLNVKHVFVGHDFTFGERRSGTTETLEILGRQQGVVIHVVAAQMKEGTLISSSLIRKLLEEGRVELAAGFLDRDFFVDGTVVTGHRRGAELGLHTANLSTRNEILPADGVYATFVSCKHRLYQGATNIGFNPTFSNTERSVETHIFDFDGDIHGQDLRLYFVRRLRDEIRFVSPEALMIQIKKDIEACRKILSRRKQARVA